MYKRFPIKKFTFCLILLVNMGFMLFAENSNLQVANTYYDIDDYSAAKTYFLKAIDEGAYNGVVFYRLGYSLEQLNEDESMIIQYYQASKYCFKKNNELSDPYYEKVLSKLQKYEVTENLTEDAFKNIINRQKQTVLLDQQQSQTNETKEGLSLKGYIILAIVIYLVALILSKTTSCVIVYGWFDLIILVVPMILTFVITTVDPFDLKNPATLIPLTFSFVFSIFGNLKANKTKSIWLKIFFILFSIVSKFFIYFIAPLILLSIIFAGRSGKKDGRYSDGTKNNQRSAILGLIAGLLLLLFCPLIKTKDDFPDDNIKENNNSDVTENKES